MIEILNRTAGSSVNVESVYNNLHDENRVIYLTYEDYLKSLDINKWYGNSVNYNDCTILNTMMSLGITTIVSFDGGFDNIKGFNVISTL